MKKSTTEEFIEKAKKIHGDKYDYRKVDYKNNKTKITIICSKHGEFQQTPSDHLAGKGCSKCSGCYSPTTEEFIEKAIKIHGNKYDYSKVVYKDSHSKITIVCPIHGEFEQAPTTHLAGNGCPTCSGNAKLTKEDFVKRAKEKHGEDKYDYSKVVYKTMQDKICIICPEHGEFWQLPSNHLRYDICCPKCNMRVSDKFDFIKKSKEIHGDKYDYSKVNYKNNYTKITIVCPEHGEFQQTPHNHLAGKGCKKCAIDSSRSTTEEFIKKAIKKYGNKYDYSKVVYRDSITNVIIICPIHGEFQQTPRYHLHRGTCPNCVRDKSKKLHSYSNLRICCDDGEKPVIVNSGKNKGPLNKSRCKNRKKYSKEEIFKLGQKYETKSEFARAYPSAYHASLKNSWLDEMTHWQIPKRQKPIMDIPNNLIYCYEFPDKVVYIGRTSNITKRNKEHKKIHRHSDGRITKGAVLKYSEKTGISIPPPKVLKDNLTLFQSREEEDNFCKEYKNNGYTLLNIAKTGKYSGSLGACLLYDDYEQILDTAKKYSGKFEFIKKHGGMYSAVKRMGLWKQLVEDVGWKKHVSGKDIYVYFSKNMELFGIFPSITDTIKATKVSKYRIFGVINKKIKDADGFIFSFQELS